MSQIKGVESLQAYIPMDRRQAMVEGKSLPDRVRGAALFADISGFTPLTEALVRELGAQRGAEELTRHLNRVYDALIAELHRFGGSVIGFGGDAITCWLDGDDGFRAAVCALAMQARMVDFASVEIPSGRKVSLAMKAAVATGSARRFIVGDPQIQLIDVLAGATLDRLNTGEHLAQRGEVVLDPSTLSALGERVPVVAWREDHESGERFGVVEELPLPVAPSPWRDVSQVALGEERLRVWLLPPVYERLRAGRGEFLAEFRPAVALFLNFSGIDYDADESAQEKLDAYIRWVQSILAPYDAYLLQVAMGDKGSYLYAAFGAPTAHEDDSVRAVSAALELKVLPPSLAFIRQVQIGISQGRIWSGAYGGANRRCYGMMGDDVNLAARLMQAAAAGQVLVSQPVHQSAAEDFAWESLPAIRVKGKSDLITVFSPIRARKRRTLQAPELQYALPMVGREAELALIQQKLNLVLEGRGQIIGVTGEAGIGKTRLVSEAMRLAREQGLVGYASECESYGTNTSYLVWRPIWRAFFGIDPTWDLDEQLAVLERQLTLIDPQLVARLPLLGSALNLPIPDNDLTRSFDAKLRKESLEALLVDCLRARAGSKPMLFVLEDSHWIDPLSADLAEVIGRAVADLPVILILAYRPPEPERAEALRVSTLQHFAEIPLIDFTPAEAKLLIALKLEQFFGSDTEPPAALVERITTRAEGNPFYIEELINYLHDRGIEPHDSAALEQLDLPTSLHSLIISRLDQRTESQKVTLRVASVIGRLFRATLLWGMYPEIGSPERVKADLEALCRLDLTRAEAPEPELAYLFKHIVTQEVAYESLPYATRAMLHEQLAYYIEREFAEPLEQYVDLLAFHYERSENLDKKREYLLKAGKAAQAGYANAAAINYYQRLLALLPAEQQLNVMLSLGEVLQLVGRWDDVNDLCRHGVALAERLGDRRGLARCQTAKAELLRKQGAYAEAEEWFGRARAGFEELGDEAGVALVFHYRGTLAAQQGDYEAAHARWHESLEIRRRLDDKAHVAALLSNLGIVAGWQRDFDLAQALHEGALMLREELGDKWAIAVSLNNLGMLALEESDYATARARLEEAVALQREVGDRSTMATSLNTLGDIVRAQGDYTAARAMYEESLTIQRQLGDKWHIAYLLDNFGCLAALQGQQARALRLVGAAAGLRATIGAQLSPTDKEKLEQSLVFARQTLGESAAAAHEAAGLEMSMEQAIEEALSGH